LIGRLYFTVGAYWSVTTDLSKTHAGTLSGVMNMGANVGGVISPALHPGSPIAGVEPPRCWWPRSLPPAAG